MSTYHIPSAQAYGPVEFSDDEWAKIEAASKRTLSAELRERVHHACWWYLISYEMESNRISGAEIRKSLAKVHSHCRFLMDLLVDRHDDDAHRIALRLIRERHFPPQHSLDQYWDHVSNIAIATERALKELPRMAVPSRPGPAHSGSTRYLVCELANAFEAAGGNAAKSHRSAFSDLVYQVLCCLPGHPHPQSPVAVGEMVRKHLAARRRG